MLIQILFAFALQSKVGPVIKPITYQGQQVYRTSHALIVADDVAASGLPEFGESAKTLRKTLVDVCGFPSENITPLSSSARNLSAKSVRDELKKLSNPEWVGRSDRVLIVFAVHGTLVGKNGYFMVPKGKNQRFPMREVADYVLDKDKGIKAKHILLLADSCYSGALAPYALQKSFDPNDTVARRLQQQFRGIMAAASFDKTATTNGHSTVMISAIVNSLSQPSTYINGIATYSSVLKTVQSSAPVTFVPSAEGTYLFSLIPSGMKKAEEDRVKNEQSRKLRERVAQLSYQLYLKVVNLQREADNIAVEEHPTEWAIAQHNLANAYRELPTGNRPLNVDHSIDLLKEAEAKINSAENPKEWSAIQNDLAISYLDRMLGDRHDNLMEALKRIDLALSFRSQEKGPQDWAFSMMNKGNILSNLSLIDLAYTADSAKPFYDQALNVFTEPKDKEIRATILNNIGANLIHQRRGDVLKFNKDAVDYLKAALDLRTLEDSPITWATTQHNLGTAHYNLALILKRKQDDGVDTELGYAIQHFEESLKVRTKEDFRIEWARTYQSLGNALTDLSTHTEANMKRGIECYEKALEVARQDRLMMMWADIANNLGLTYLDVQLGDPASNVKKSIDYISQSLKIRTEALYPIDWAEGNFNLGLAYLRAGNKEQAKTCFTVARDVAAKKQYDGLKEAAEKELKKLAPPAYVELK